jgi:hypothetical protein
MWYRIFAPGEQPPDLESLRLHLLGRGFAEVAIDADADPWLCANVTAGGVVLNVERYTADEEGIRAELNAWAAVIEAADDTAAGARLMERLIQSRQLITVEAPEGPLGRETSAWIAQVTAGVYQADGRGFIAPEGVVLVAVEDHSP